jgi:K+-sensing histidine kinase KdpD
MEPSSGIPIKIQDNIVGVINFDERSFRDAYGDEGLEALKNVGNILAISLKSARLANQIRLLDSVRTDFISSFPHELRTPITVIKESLSMLTKGSLGQITDKQKDVLMLAETNLARLWTWSS